MLSDMMQPARSLDADESSVTTVTRHFLFLFLSRQQKQNNTKWCVIIGKKTPVQILAGREQRNQTTGKSFYFVVWPAQGIHFDYLQLTELAGCRFLMKSTAIN